MGRIYASQDGQNAKGTFVFTQGKDGKGFYLFDMTDEVNEAYENQTSNNWNLELKQQFAHIIWTAAKGGEKGLIAVWRGRRLPESRIRMYVGQYEKEWKEQYPDD